MTESPVLTAHIVTLFPQLFSSWLGQGVVSRAVARGIALVDLIDLRPFGVGAHHMTDDYPFGGGPGMVMKPEPLFAAVESMQEDSMPVILLSPRGRKFNQSVARELAGMTRFVLLAGHYEGVDERVRQHLATDEISIGDYVLSAGELAAMVVVDAAVRLLPGALGVGSTDEESFSEGLLEYPQYTRPALFGEWEVPQVLLSGHHGKVAQWRREQAVIETARCRPDLIDAAVISDREQCLIETFGLYNVDETKQQLNDLSGTQLDHVSSQSP